MIRLSGQLICATADDAMLLLLYLPDHIRRSRAEPGCLSFEVTRTTDPLVWQVEECFATRIALDAHRMRTRASPWFAATRHLTRRYRTYED
jgi:quinol monooxygenase YgiN